MSSDVERREDLIAERVDDLSSALDAHAGGLELTGIHEGEVTLRFTGMCTGCPLRTVTMAGLVRPALLEIEGVEAVHAEGARISREAEERLQRLTADGGSTRLLCALEDSSSKGRGSRSRDDHGQGGSRWA